MDHWMDGWMGFVCFGWMDEFCLFGLVCGIKSWPTAMIIFETVS